MQYGQERGSTVKNLKKMEKDYIAKYRRSFQRHFQRDFKHCYYIDLGKKKNGPDKITVVSST